MLYIVYFDRGRRIEFREIEEALNWGYSKKEKFPMYGFTIYKYSYYLADERRILNERSVVCRVN